MPAPKIPRTSPAGVNLAPALGEGGRSDKRLDILRRVGEAGSISEAARSAGVSYKAAWQAVETLSNLAGATLVERAVGGTGGGGARLTAEGQQLLEAAHRLQAARQRWMRELQAAGDAPAQASLGGLLLRTSMRNQLPCQVERLRRAGGALQVLLRLPDGQALAARITRESGELLALRAGQAVLALCKATAVRIHPQLDAAQTDAAGATLPAVSRLSTVNALQGVVSRGAAAARGGEVSLALPSGQQLVGMLPPGVGLRRGAAAWACFDPQAVVIALAG